MTTPPTPGAPPSVADMAGITDMMRTPTTPKSTEDWATDMAAQIWCRPELGDRVMDAPFAMAIAEELRAAESRGEARGRARGLEEAIGLCTHLQAKFLGRPEARDHLHALSTIIERLRRLASPDTTKEGT